MVDETKQYVLLKEELEKTLKSFVELFGTENSVTKEKELKSNLYKLLFSIGWKSDYLAKNIV